MKPGSEQARHLVCRAFQASLAVLLAIGLSGCATDQPKPTGGVVSVPRKVQNPRADDAQAGGVPQKDLDEVLTGMSGAIQHGDYERALGLGDQLLRRKPNEEQRGQIERLRKVAKQHLLQTFYVDAVVRTEKPRVTIGEPIKGEVTLINVGTEPIVILDAATAAAQGSSRTLLHLEVGYREFAPDGTIVRETLSSNVIIGRDITIKPANRHAIPLQLDTLAQNPAGTMLRNYDIGGTVFLAELKVGQETIYGQLKLKTKRVQVFPRNWEHLAERPLEKLADAIRKRSPTHIPLAAALVPEAQQREALVSIRDALRAMSAAGPDAPVVTACCVALVVLTGEERKADAELWLGRLDELLK